ncbi:MAG: subtilisin-like proprotein convertase family protein [Bradymonadia bacterium]|jgi:subtilisin-like proprotein convertase family protein
MLRRFAFASLALLALGCGEATTPDAPNTDNEPVDPADQPLSDLSAIFEGAPANDSIPEDGKFDAVYPAQFDLIDTQSPIRSQGRRGTCSIFATVALMEQLYNIEGSVSDPDFSEQMLQWSAKVELGAFPNTGGSSSSRNLEAINRFGVVQESVQPYEASQWGTSEDEACTGDDQPTRCYTNGDPAQDVLDARRFHLPRGRWVNCRPRSIQAYMSENNVGVVAGMDFFYQSWNHGGSSLETSSEHKANGWITYPSEADKTDSAERPAGHAIFLIGWDDELSVPLLDAEGVGQVDENGDPVMETGFYLFKNSWGTSGFGSNNPFGAGYGWIAQRYVEEYATCYSSTVPVVEVNPEVCDNGTDDDLNGTSDCEDPACAADAACRAPGANFEGTGGNIPDNDETGFQSSVNVELEGNVVSATVTYDITHTYRGDLTVAVVAPNGARAVLHAAEGGSEDNLAETETIADFAGLPVAGEWTLSVVDAAGEDVGSVNSWSVEFELGGDLADEDCDNGVDDNGDGAADCADSACLEEDVCASAETLTFDGDSNLAIPDDDPSGVDSIIEVVATGAIAELSIDVAITHPFRGDIKITLENENGVRVTLIDAEGSSEDNLVRTFTPTEFVGENAAGLWLLNVADGGRLDEGTLDSWSLTITVQ